MTTSYPNREHQNLHASAKRRARAVLTQMEEQAAILRTKLAPESPGVDGSDAVRFEELAGKLREYLTIIETLREVREWHQAGLAGQPSQFTCLGCRRVLHTDAEVQDHKNRHGMVINTTPGLEHP